VVHGADGSVTSKKIAQNTVEERFSLPLECKHRPWWRANCDPSSRIAMKGHGEFRPSKKGSLS
jgi:hypothetical protein